MENKKTISEMTEKEILRRQLELLAEASGDTRTDMMHAMPAMIATARQIQEIEKADKRAQWRTFWNGFRYALAALIALDIVLYVVLFVLLA
jgi:hypothetical protein